MISFVTGLVALYGFPSNEIITESTCEELSEMPEEKEHLMGQLQVNGLGRMVFEGARSGGIGWGRKYTYKKQERIGRDKNSRAALYGRTWMAKKEAG